VDNCERHNTEDFVAFDLIMETKKILVPIDLSEITGTVVAIAIKFAKKTGMALTLLHIKHIKSRPDVEQQLQTINDEIIAKDKVICNHILKSGSVFNEIATEASNPEYAFAIIGTHGFKGLREVMFGADILRLLKAMPVPVLTVLKGYVLPEAGINKILMPVASHTTFNLIIDATVKFAKWFDAEVHLYSIEKPEMNWTQQLIDNIKLAETTFKKEGVTYIRINEKFYSYSIGYSKQTLQYAQNIDAGLIAIMSSPAKEHIYFADGDKEQLITNKYRIPVLSASNCVSLG